MMKSASFLPGPTLLVFALAGCGGAEETATGAGGTATGSGGGSSTSASTSTSASASASASTSTSTSASTTGGGRVCSGKVGAAGDYDGSVISGGEARTYRAHAPPGYDPSQPTMVVLVFHGLLETAADIEAISVMTPIADAQGFLVVYPQGVSNSWNAGDCCGTARSSGVDDVQLVRDVLDDLESRYCVDTARVHATGFSNGGMLSHRLGCELADRIAAIGGVAGVLNIDTCTPSRPVPVMHVHGTSDLIVPYGGEFAPSVDETIAAWVAHDGCTDAMPASVFSNGDSHCEEHSQCLEGTAVRRCTVEGGGHQWPGGVSSGSPGHLTMDISASQELYQFFLAHPMP